MKKYDERNVRNSFLNFGFSLMELIVVVSIIAVLSGISAFALGGARESGKDTKRKADLSQVASGLELYKADLNFYPNSITFGGTLAGGGNTYIEAIPDDSDSTRDYRYMPTKVDGTACAGDCVRFKLWTALEVEPTPTPASYCGTAPNCGSVTCNFCVTNP